MAKTTPMRAIRQKCLECSNNQPKEIRECPIADCPLYVYRLGKNPAIQRKKLSEEQKQVLTDRLQVVRKNVPEK